MSGDALRRLKMKPKLTIFLGIVVATLTANAENKLVAVSIRYLQVEGTSHAHIFLYDWDGRLLRQLTKGENGQDLHPVFSPDGREIAFTRKLPTGDEFRLINLARADTRKIEAPPTWYQSAAAEAPSFSLRINDEATGNAGTPSPSPTPARLVAPDGSIEIVLDRTGDEEKDYDQGQLGRRFKYRDLKSGEESLIGDWPGFETIWDPLHFRGEEDQCFLIAPPLRTIFFFTHLNSTDGDTIHALDLMRRRLVRLGPNGAIPIPIPNEASFFSEMEERYRPLGDSKRTVNCSYLERWDSEFRKIRYSRDFPAIFGGACAWREGSSPLTMFYGIRGG